MDKKNADTNPPKPSKLADEVADLLKAQQDDDEVVNPQDGRYRDIELEQKIAAQKAAQKEMQIAEDELESVIEEEQDFVATTRGKDKHKEKTRKQAKTEAKKSKEAKKENTRQITKNLQKKKELTQQILQGLKASREGALKMGKKAVEKIAAYKMHVERAPGEQAGVFDKQKKSPEHDTPQKKRTMEHDKDLGSEARTHHVKVDLGKGITAEATITERVDDDKKTGQLKQVGKVDVKIDNVKKDGADVSGSLGSLSPDAVVNAMKRDDAPGVKK